MIGYGNSFFNFEYSGGTVDISDENSGQSYCYAWSAPRNTTLRAISAFINLTSTLTLAAGVSLTVVAEVFISTVPNNLFSGAPGATVQLTFTGVNPHDTFKYGTTSGLNIAIPVGTRVLVMFYATIKGSTRRMNITTYAAGGLDFS